MDYMRTLFGAFCEDDADVEARCLLALSLFISVPFINVDHRGRDRAEVVELALKQSHAVGVAARSLLSTNAIYTLAMAIRVSLFAVPAVVVTGLVLLLNGLDASAGIAVAAFGLVAVATGSAARRTSPTSFLSLPRTRRPHCSAGVHHGG